ncbi:hypothetical protein [Roseomonas sp. KE2513]|nr:hypothetical protein [Roseomonas sp. KE2513]
MHLPRDAAGGDVRSALLPIGQYFLPFMHRIAIMEIGSGTAVFWNVRPA